MQAERAGKAIAEARRAGRKMDAYPGEAPATVAEGYAVQDAMTRAMGDPVVGWKVGLTSALAQEICGVDAPIAGPLFESQVAESGAALSLVEGDLGVLEAEVGFRMATDLPPRAAAYGRNEVLAAVGAVIPVIEWVNKRLPGGLREVPGWIAADGALNRGLVCGAGVALAPGMDLARERVEVRRDGAVVTEGLGANALGDPAAVLVWLANDLRARGKGLSAGDRVATGLICEVVQAEPGASYRAEFSSIGRVEMRVV